MDEEKTLAELAEESGVAARTIRFYIARGLLNGPVKAGRGAVYTRAHRERLEKIKSLQAKGRHLAEIAGMMDGPGATGRAAYESAPWWRHTIADDVVVWTRGDVSPWRQKQIREAMDEMAVRLRRKDDGE